MPSLDSRREPLLGASGHSRNASKHWCSAAAKLCVLPSFVLAYVIASTIERVVFARMAASMDGQVLLMHTALAALNTLLFIVLRLARSQSSRSVVSAELHANPRPRPSLSPDPGPDPNQVSAKLQALQRGNARKQSMAVKREAATKLQALQRGNARKQSMAVNRGAATKLHYSGTRNGTTVVVRNTKAIALLFPR